MSNKYTWVIFNLVASIGCFIVLYTTDFSAVLQKQLGLIPLVFVVANAVWIYKTIIYWRKCIQADDPAFDKVVTSLQEEPDNKQAKSKSKTDKAESLS